MIPTRSISSPASNDELTGRYDDPSDNHFRLDPDEVSPEAGAVVVGRLDDRAVACGALRRIPDIDSEIDGDIDGTGLPTAEIKRMYVAPEARGNKLGAGDPRPSRARGGRPRDRPPRARDGEPAAGGDPAVRARRVHGSRRGGASTPTAPHSRCFEKRLVLGDDQQRRLITRPAARRRRGARPTGRLPRRRWVSHTSRGSG